MSAVEGWKTESLGRIANITMGQSPDSKYYSEEKNGLPFLQGCAEFTSRFPKHALYCSQTKKIANSGEILFSVRAPVGKINIADCDYIIGRGLAAISGAEIDHVYLEYYLKYEEPRFRNASQGSTFEAINSSELSKWLIEYPISRAEQTKIAEILSTVDRAIEQTEALIAKQQRIKTGLMQDLLTRGIDEHGNLRSELTHKFKDSPLGRIPVEWEVDELGKVAAFVTSGSRNWAQYYSTEGTLFIRIGNLTRDHINLRFEDIVYVVPPRTAEGNRTSVSTGDLLISITADLGIIGVIPENFGEGYVNQHIALVRLTKERSNPRFIGWFLSGHSGQTQFAKLNESGAKAGLNLPTIKKLLVPVTNPIEQATIAEILDANTNRVTALYAKLKKLHAIKSALTRDLLTGKKRVIIWKSNIGTKI
jgi:type I restriction enzyme S subunit